MSERKRVRRKQRAWPWGKLTAGKIVAYDEAGEVVKRWNNVPMRPTTDLHRIWLGVERSVELDATVARVDYIHPDLGTFNVSPEEIADGLLREV